MCVLSVREQDKQYITDIAKALICQGYTLVATKGTQATLAKEGIEAKRINKIAEGQPNVVDLIKNGEIQLVINTPSGKYPIKDEIQIRQAALAYTLPVITTIQGALATVKALPKYLKNELEAKSIQDWIGQTVKEDTVPA